jgi:hypothetical protein
MSTVRLVVQMAAVLVVCHGVARAAPRRIAESQDPAARITQLNRDALAAIDKREFEKAREILKKALDACQSSGLAQHPIAARTHLHMGVVIIEGFKNRELGEKQFTAALAIEPTIAMTPALVTPEISDAFDEAKDKAKNGSAASAASAGSESSPDTAPASTPASAPRDDRPAAGSRVHSAAASGGGFTYHTVSEVKQGNAIRVTVNVDENLRFHKVVLAYRPQGTSEFLGREMDPVGAGAYSAEIPDGATTGSSVAYYIEAEDDDGQPVATRGTEERPLVIQLGGDASPPAHARSAVAAKPSESDDSTTVREEGESEDQTGHWFASVLVGSGIGYAKGTGETNANLPVSGSFAGTSLGHVAPEIGYWVSPDLLISAQGRIQVVSGPTELVDSSGRVYAPADLAVALFAKASLFFGSDAFRPFISGGLGGGQIRHVVTFGAYRDCGATRDQTCVDSVAAGPALAEVGAGFLYKLGPTLALEASSNLQIAEPKFTFNVDLNAGVAFNF